MSIQEQILKEELFRIKVILTTMLSPCRFATLTPHGYKKTQSDTDCLCCKDKGGWKNCPVSSYDPSKDEITYQLFKLCGS